MYGETGRAILQGDNVVLVIPRLPLPTGRYGVDIQAPGSADTQWSFTVIPPS